MTVTTLETAGVAFFIGVTATVFAFFIWQTVKMEYQRYTDAQVREAKHDLKDWVRERER